MKLHQPDWGDGSHSVALGAELREEGLHFHLILNAYWEPLDFELPRLTGGDPWRRWIDTALDSPHDIVPWQTGAAGSGRHVSGGRPLRGDALPEQQRVIVADSVAAMSAGRTAPRTKGGGNR